VKLKNDNTKINVKLLKDLQFWNMLRFF